LEDGSFDFIIHDPQESYIQLFRILKKRGRMFHYTGEPGKLSGKNFAKGIVKRSLLAGFRKVVKAEEAKGVVAFKG